MVDPTFDHHSAHAILAGMFQGTSDVAESVRPPKAPAPFTHYAFVLTSQPGVDVLAFRSAEEAKTFISKVPRQDRCAGPVLVGDMPGTVAAVLKLATASIDAVVWVSATDPLNVRIAAGADGDTWGATAIAQKVSVPAAFTEPTRLAALVQAAGNVALLRAAEIVAERDRATKIAETERAAEAAQRSIERECERYSIGWDEGADVADEKIRAVIKAERNRVRKLARKAKRKAHAPS